MNSYYFPHDYSAHSDPKIVSLIMECGMAAVGVYWILMEILHTQENGMITKEDLQKYLKFYLSQENNPEKLREKITTCLLSKNLLLEKNEFVFSERVLLNKKVRKKISKKRAAAGRKGGAAKALTKASNCQTNAKQLLDNVQAKPSNKIKRNKIKRKEIKEESIHAREINYFVNLVKESHDDFKNVSILTIENIIKTYIVDHRDLIEPAIREMSLRYNGVSMPTPVGHLMNYLQKHLDRQEKQTSEAVKRKTMAELKVEALAEKKAKQERMGIK